jgi:hypothetical protein
MSDFGKGKRPNVGRHRSRVEGCRKFRYSTPAKARKALKRHSGLAGAKSSYLCPICTTDGEQVFHLTSQRS